LKRESEKPAGQVLLPELQAMPATQMPSSNLQRWASKIPWTAATSIGLFQNWFNDFQVPL
jgi:hypothetical protein